MKTLSSVQAKKAGGFRLIFTGGEFGLLDPPGGAG